METDSVLRAAFFGALARLQLRHPEFGGDLPYVGALDQGFEFDGDRVPFLNPYKGIHRSARQRGPAALSLMTSHNRPYSDEETDDGFWYAYRSGQAGEADNRALRAAAALQVPLAYFVGVQPGRFQVVAPIYVVEDDHLGRQVRMVPGIANAIGEPALPDDELERRYGVRQVTVRLHQRRFRGLVLPAYRTRCAICRLKEEQLLDAAHIVPDSDPTGAAAVTNGLSLCTIHHRAFDHDLVGISPDHLVHVAPRLLEDEDGPMLELLKGFHKSRIELPTNVARRPDRERLETRFARFQAAA